MRFSSVGLMLVVGAAVIGVAEQAEAWSWACTGPHGRLAVYRYGNTFEYVGGPWYQRVRHVRYIDRRTFRHHIFETVLDQRVFHTAEYRRTRISGEAYTPSYGLARRMYRSGR